MRSGEKRAGWRESFRHTKDKWGMDGKKDEVNTIPLAVPEGERSGHGDLRWFDLQVNRRENPRVDVYVLISGDAVR